MPHQKSTNLPMKPHGLSSPYNGALLVFVIALVAFSLSASLRPLTSRGEGREGLMVRDMQSQSNYVLPLRLGNVVPSKPPMFHWLALGAAKSIGELNPLILRLPSVFTAALSLSLIFLFVWCPLAANSAFATVVFTATSFEFFRTATHARVDMCFSFFLLGAILLSFRLINARIDKKPTNLSELLLLSVVLAAAVLTKGPTGILLPTVIGLLYAFFARSGRSLLTFSPLLLAPLFGLLLSGIWYYAAFQQSGMAFLETHLLRENIGRIFSATGATVGHEKGVFLGFLDFFVASLPWGLFLPLVLAWLLRSRAHLQEPRFRPTLLSLLTIAVFFFAVFVSRSKRPVYFLPCLCFYSYLLIQALDDFAPSRRLTSYLRGFARILQGTSFVLILLILTLAISLLTRLPASLSLALESALALLPLSVPSQALFLLSVIAVALVVVVSLHFICKHLRDGAVARAARNFMMLMVFLLFAASNIFLAQIFYTQRLDEFTKKVQTELDNGRTLYQYERIFYPLSFYLGHAHAILPKDAAVPTPLESTSLLVREDNLSQVLTQFPEAKTLAKSRLASGSSKHGAILVRLR